MIITPRGGITYYLVLVLCNHWAGVIKDRKKEDKEGTTDLLTKEESLLFILLVCLSAKTTLTTLSADASIAERLQQRGVVGLNQNM